MNASINSGLLTMPNFYHKNLNELINEYDEKIQTSARNKEYYLNQKIRQKMRKQLEQVKKVSDKHDTIIKS